MHIAILGGGGGNSDFILVPMREQGNAYKGVFLRRARIREKGGKIGQKQEKGWLFRISRKKRVKMVFFRKFWNRILASSSFLFEDKY